MKIGILGHGEIGQAIEELYLNFSNPRQHPEGWLGKVLGKVFVKDLYVDEGIENCDHLHVCIPYSDDFVDQVCECIKKENPNNVIIHSTVQVGTTREIVEASGMANICHAPVRGVHPNLYEGLKTFPMYIGCEQTSLRIYVIHLFSNLGVQIKIVPNFETSELAKLVSTTYYGMCIAFHGEMQLLCSEIDLNFEDVMTEWNKGYNEGYKKLGMDHVVRPVLRPPDGKIGGHCVIANAKLLQEYVMLDVGTETRQLTDLILKYE
jgi:UDP-N-acetyl-D-mannosaminuronate dehydrogenase